LLTPENDDVGHEILPLTEAGSVGRLEIVAKGCNVCNCKSHR